MTNDSTATVDGAAVRGLPRPLNRRGLPVPYVAESPERLGDKSRTRAPEVTRGWLCQVCGESSGDPAYALMLAEPARWEPDWVLDHGLLHGVCLRLALEHCPALQRYLGDRKLRVLLVRRAQVTITMDLQLVIPVASHDDLDVPIVSLLELHQ